MTARPFLLGLAAACLALATPARADSPDFATYPALIHATWGCGTDCLMGAAIDAWSGRRWQPG